MEYVFGPLPDNQHEYEDLDKLSVEALHARRERVFLLLAGVFLGTLAILNIVGITRFIDLSFHIPGLGWKIPMVVAVGVLPYPVTFLCTDFISELYGRQRANTVVFVGFLLNLWVVAILYVGGALPGFESKLYDDLQTAAFGAVWASMVAYTVAQLVDVHVFHFWKRVTGGRHLWLRNNGSTLVSQLVDTIAVILITHFYAGALPVVENEPLAAQLLAFIAAGYAFKLVAALLDTLPFYVGTLWLSRFLRLAPPASSAASLAVPSSVGD